MDELILSYRYTSSSANVSQSTPENSLGGYISTNNIYTTTAISDRVSQTATIVPVGAVPATTSGLAQIDTEIISYAGIDSTNSQLINVTRGVVPAAFPHGITPLAGEVRYLTVNRLFDPKFDSNYIQYRCIAIRNASTFAAENVTIYKVADRDSDVTIDLGIEVPFHDYRTGTITGTPTGLVIANSNFAGLFSDDYFTNSLLRLTSGTSSGNTAIINSYTDSTGTFVLASTLGSPVAGNAFEIEPAPSQTVANQLTGPALNSNLFFGFIDDGGSNLLSYNDIRENLNVFQVSDIFYLWIRRTLTKNVKSKSDTGFIALIGYQVAGT